MKTEMEKLLQEEEISMLQISCEYIQQSLEEGKIQGSFYVSSTTGKVVKGKVMVTDPRVQCRETAFQSEKVEISYYFDGSDMEAGEVISGLFMLITNFGEFEIPFTFSYPKENLGSSLGEIRNLFHFTNLARTNWQEALKLYFSPAFEEILKNADHRAKEIYRGLSGEVREQYMDEFLNSIHKKSPVEFETEKEITDLVNITENVCTELTIRKKGWGYTKLSIETRGDFIRLEKEKVLQNNFLPNSESKA